MATAKKALPVRGQRTATNMAKAMTSPVMGSAAQEKKWQAQDYLRTLQRAAEIKSKAMTSPVMGSAAQEKKWQAQDYLRTLQRAAEIKSDPSRVKAAQSEATQQMKALQTVTKK